MPLYKMRHKGCIPASRFPAIKRWGGQDAHPTRVTRNAIKRWGGQDAHPTRVTRNRGQDAHPTRVTRNRVSGKLSGSKVTIIP
ncbi:hypothetical protein [Microseira wollei]|uniref:hypothetical protein n=1 Tax=Microseira wollei TaxID=467598 RepID=UPI001CFE93A7|nr:hypothetical protein [Microseira wollei]